MEHTRIRTTALLALLVVAGCTAPPPDTRVETAPAPRGTTRTVQVAPAPPAAEPAATRPPDAEQAEAPPAAASRSEPAADTEPPAAKRTEVAVDADSTPPLEPAPDVAPEPARDAVAEPAPGDEDFAQSFREMVKRSKVPDGWSFTDTEHHLIVYDEDVDKNQLERLKVQLTLAWRQLLEPLLPPAHPITAVSVVRVCESKSQFVEYGGPAGSAGYWSARGNELVLYEDSSNKKGTLRSARSLLCQSYVYHALDGALPHEWFTAGHGDFFAGHTLKGDKFRVGTFSWRVASAREAKRRWSEGLRRGSGRATEGTNLDLREWLTWSREQYHGRNDWSVSGVDNYALGWSLIYFLRTSDNPAHAQILTRYWDTLVRLVRAEASEQNASASGATRKQADRPDRSTWRSLALDAALKGVDIEALESEWLAYD